VPHALTARSRREAAELGLRYAVGAFAGVGAAAVGLSALLRAGPEDAWLTVALLAVWAAVAVRAALGHGGVGTALVLAGTALAPLALIGAPAPAGILPTIAAMPTMVAVAGAVLVRRLPLAVALSAGVLGVQLAAGTARSGPRAAVGWLAPVAMVAVMAFITRLALSRSARRADLRDAEQQRAEVAATRARARASAQTSWQGLLHDEVAAALRAACTPGVGRLEVRRSAVDALTAIDGVGAGTGVGQVDLIDALRELVAGTVTPVELSGPAELALPGPAVAALSGAVAEALRNVDRHAGATRAQVAVVRRGAQVRVRVGDDGCGFTPPSRLPAGGLRLSIVERMAQVGGFAEVLSAPGRGATVELVWSPAGGEPAAQGDASSADRAAWGEVGRALTLAALPALAAAGIVAGVRVRAGAVGPAGLAWYGLVMLATWGTLRRGRSRLPLWWSVGAVALAEVGALVLVARAPASGWTDGALWPVIAIGPVLLLVSLGSPRWLGATAFLAIQVGLIWVGLADRVRLDALLAGLVGAAYLLIVGWVLARASAGMVAGVERAVADDRDQVLRAWERAVHREVQGSRVARLDELVLPFLRALADGSLSADDEPVRVWARQLEQAVRDELHLPQVLDAQTRARVREARAQGCRVRFQSDGMLEPPHDLICGVVQAALAGPQPPRELTVSVYLMAGPPTVAVVAVPGDPDRAAQLRSVADEAIAVLADQPDATWAEIRLPGGRTMTG
jgi:signal transduction histidine kinase